MAKFRIYWDGGFGFGEEVIEAPSIEAAKWQAQLEAREDFESNYTFGAEEVVEEAKEPEPTNG